MLTCAFQLSFHKKPQWKMPSVVSGDHWAAVLTLWGSVSVPGLGGGAGGAWLHSASGRVGSCYTQSALRGLTALTTGESLNRKFRKDDGRGISRVKNAQADGHQRILQGCSSAGSRARRPLFPSLLCFYNKFAAMTHPTLPPNKILLL